MESVSLAVSSPKRNNHCMPQQCVLRERQLSFDPHLHQQAFRKRLYSQPSFVKRFEIEKRLENHNGCVNCINFSESGSLLASGSDDLQIVLWDWAKGSPVSSFNSKHVANVFQAKFMPQTNDSVIVSSARDGQVRCHVLSSTGELVSTQRVSYHNESAHKLALEPDNPHVFLSCGEDSNVMEIDLRMNNSQRNKLISVRDIKRNRIALYSIFINPSNYNLFAVSGRDEFARVYDRRVLSESKASEDTGPMTYHEPIEMYCPTKLITDDGPNAGTHMTCLAYSHDGKELLCSYNDEDIYTFDTTVPSESHDYTKCFEGHRNSATVKGVNYFGLNSDYIVSGSDCGHVFLWDKNTTEIVQYLKGDFEGVVNCLEPHPHIPVLAVSGLDHDIKLISPLREKNSDLEGLAEVVETNAKRRKEDSEYSLDGYDFLLGFIMRQYRRGLRRRAGIESDEDDSSNDSDNDDMTDEDDDDNEDDDDDIGEDPPTEGRRGHRRRRRRSEGSDDDDRHVECVQS